MSGVGGDMTDVEPVDAHLLSCPVWTSDDGLCDCGAEFPLLVPEPGSTADHLTRIREAS